MFATRVLFPGEGGNVNLLVPNPDCGLTLEEIIAKDLPAGTPHLIVTVDQLPSDPRYRQAWEVDFSQDAPEVTINPEKKATIDRAIALKELDDWFSAQIAAGMETAGGWKLGLTQADVTLLTGNYVLAKEAAAMGGPVPPVVDTDGVPHEMADIAELTALMLGYGQYRAALSAEYAERKAEIVGG